MTDIKLLRGDMIEESDQIEDGSIDLILTDPPYGTMKGFTAQYDWDDAIDPETILKIAQRILRKNGRLILFAQEPYTSELIQSATTCVSFSYRCIWKKDHFGNPLLAKKAPVNMFEDIIVFTKSYDSEGQHPLRSYSKQLLEYIGHSLNDINKELGHRAAEHFFYVDSSQFELCTRETYSELIERYSIDEMDGFKDYDTIEAIDRGYKQQHQPVFNLPEGQKTKHNILEYSKPHEGKHPTQKPVPLLVELIETYTNPGDTVADLTMGSGSTGVAAQQISRNFIGIELLDKYYEVAQQRIAQKSIA